MSGNMNIKTFSRKKERRQKLKSVNSAEHLPGRERIPAPQKDEGTSSQCSDENENVSPNKCHALPERNSERGSAKVHYSRKVAPTQEDRQNAALQRYVSIMRAHFEEVDQFELLTEIETPVNQGVEDISYSSPSENVLDNNVGSHPSTVTALHNFGTLTLSTIDHHHPVPQVCHPMPALASSEHSHGEFSQEGSPCWGKIASSQDELDERETSAEIGSPPSSRDEYLLTPGPAKASAYGLGARRSLLVATSHNSIGRGSRWV